MNIWRNEDRPVFCRGLAPGQIMLYYFTRVAAYSVIARRKGIQPSFVFTVITCLQYLDIRLFP